MLFLGRVANMAISVAISQREPDMTAYRVAESRILVRLLAARHGIYDICM
jgi:hypothetical protein